MDFAPQNTNHISSRELDNRLISPPGWVTTTLKNKNVKTENPEPDEEEKKFVHQFMPDAAARTEQLIDALGIELAIPVPACYMRIEAGSLFHVLLMIDLDNFVSPKIQAARLLADKYAKTDGSYDIRFSFAVESENFINTQTKFSAFKLTRSGKTESDEE